MNYLLVTILEPKRVVVELKGMKDKETKLTDLGFSKKMECILPVLKAKKNSCI